MQILDQDPDLSAPEHLALRNRVRKFWSSAVSDLAGA
jgi:hypothetical protein